MSDRPAHRFAVTFAAIVLSAMIQPMPCMAQTAAPALVDTEAFRVAFGLSFRLDECGDDIDGRLFRKALIEKVASCPFTDEARKKFRQWTADTDARATAEINRYIAEHGSLPDRLDGMKMSCAEVRETQGGQKGVDLLDRYSRGEVGFESIIPDRCDVRAVAP